MLTGAARRRGLALLVLGVLTIANPLLAGQPGAADDDTNAVLACWDQLISLHVERPSRAPLASQSVDRLLETTTGIDLARNLCDLFFDPVSNRPVTTLRLHFVDTVDCENDSDGCFWPSHPQAASYDVMVRNEGLRQPETTEVLAFGEYPGNPDCDVVYLFQSPQSWMAQALYHELLHVWFLNEYQLERRRYPTGHGRAIWCEFEPEFLELLAAHAEELAIVEGAISGPLDRKRFPQVERR